MREAEEYSRFIRSHSHDALPAKAWRAGLRASIATLQKLPERCPLIPEREEFPEPLHQLLYHSHRIIFRIDPGIVRVLRIYHSALRPLETLNQRPKPRGHRKTDKLELL